MFTLFEMLYSLCNLSYCRKVAELDEMDSLLNAYSTSGLVMFLGR